MLNLRSLRIEKGLTLKELSDKSSVAVGYIGDLENGKAKNPSLSILDKL